MDFSTNSKNGFTFVSEPFFLKLFESQFIYIFLKVFTEVKKFFFEVNLLKLC